MGKPAMVYLQTEAVCVAFAYKKYVCLTLVPLTQTYMLALSPEGTEEALDPYPALESYHYLT